MEQSDPSSGTSVLSCSASGAPSGRTAAATPRTPFSNALRSIGALNASLGIGAPKSPITGCGCTGVLITGISGSGTTLGDGRPCGGVRGAALLCIGELGEG